MEILSAPKLQHFLGIAQAADAAGHAEGHVEHGGDAVHPAAIHRAAFGAGGDVVEHQLVGAFVAVAARQLDDLAHDAMIAELHALDDLAVAHIEAGNYPARKNGRISSRVSRPSSSALPATTRGDPGGGERGEIGRSNRDRRMR